MHIEHIEIGGFRKLQAVRVDFAPDITVFVGANNSGKTSAMVALRYFLGPHRREFSVNDFTLSNWARLNAAALAWEQNPDEPPSQLFDWGTVLPHLDVWLKVRSADLHFVQKLLPTLDWDGELIGVRLRYEPKDLEKLQHEYLTARAAAADVIASVTSQAGEEPGAASPDAAELELWPKTMIEFLSRRLRTLFDVRAYLLDPGALVPPVGGVAKPQVLPAEREPIAGDPFASIIRIDEISAQRGFGFAPSSTHGADVPGDAPARTSTTLSSQLRRYYERHLDPSSHLEPTDLPVLAALHRARTAFDVRLKDSFSDALKELETIGYPGVTDPRLKLSAKVNAIDSLNHASAVQYEVPTSSSQGASIHHLPEDSNGLGYQNLVSMVFALMSFRDRWMRVGKAAKSIVDGEEVVPRLHLVLVEEPEAHLHAQVQQVFINQAYSVLRRHDRLQGSEELRTQLIVSTHSSHLAHEADFSSLRYFRRLPVKAAAGAVPVSSVVNLSQTFGDSNETSRFVKRYLKATHCDLFFADGAILVEGPAERILIPHFVRQREEFQTLRQSYITWLEIGGSHAHRLRGLLEQLGLNTLIITDLDAMDGDRKAKPPARACNLTTRNETLRTWVPGEASLDALFDLEQSATVASSSDGFGVCAAYQRPVQMKFKSESAVEALANTFEDALLYENAELLPQTNGGGLMGRFRKSLQEAANIEELAGRVLKDLAKGGKAEFAMELLVSDDVDAMKVPAYIERGLLWLARQLERREHGIDGKLAVGPTEGGADTADGAEDAK